MDDLILKRLLKTDLDLSARAIIGESIASVVREQKAKQWHSVRLNYQRMGGALSKLVQDGCILVHNSDFVYLADQLRRVPTKGASNTSTGNRSEVEILNNVDNLRAIHKIASDSTLYNLVSLYLGAPACFYNFCGWWQYPMGATHVPSNAQLWHRDRDDFKSLALFIYATDVDEHSGPHVYMKKSHTYDGSLSVFRASDESLTDMIIGKKHKFIDDSLWDKLGPQCDPLIWTGPSGTAFLEDTKGFHKGMVALSRPRLVLRINWTLKPSTSAKNYAFS